MWTIITDNAYARRKSNTLQGKLHTYIHTYIHTYRWTDGQMDRWTGRQAGRQAGITPSNLKMFIAHNIIMGIVKKSDLEK